MCDNPQLYTGLSVPLNLEISLLGLEIASNISLDDIKIFASETPVLFKIQ